METKALINGVDFANIKAQEYWAYTSSYSKERRKQDMKTKIFSNEYVAAEKKDGYYERIVKDDEGNVYMFARKPGVNGLIEKSAWVPHLNSFFDALPNGTCLIGEVHFPNKPGSRNITTILGCGVEKAIKRQEKEENKLHYYVFDIYAWNGDIFLKTPMEDRIGKLYNADFYISPSVKKYTSFATYVNTPQAIWKLLEEVLERGGEGIVMTMKDYPVGLGKRTAHKTLKVKRELEENIDAVFTGNFKRPARLYTGKDLANWEYWEHIKTGEKIQGKLFHDRIEGADLYEAVTKFHFYGWAGSAEVGLIRGDKVVPIGYVSGITDEIRRELVEDNKKYQLRPCEITGMLMEEDTKAIRHPKFVKFRDDLDWESCTWKKVHGED